MDDKSLFTYSNNEYIIPSGDNLSNTIYFYNSRSEKLGKLDFEDRLTFEGHADESATVFLESLCRQYNRLLELIDDIDNDKFKSLDDLKEYINQKIS